MNVSRSTSSAARLAPPAVAAILLTAGLLLTLLIHQLVSAYLEKDARQRFDTRAEATFNQIGKRLDDYRNLILGLQGMFLASEKVSRSEFRAYCRNLQLEQRLPGLQALAFQRYVRHRDKAAFIEGVRRDRTLDPAGYPGFSIRPEGERPEYVVIDYIEPMATNMTAFGYDAGSQAGNSDAIRLARDTGRFQISRPFHIVQSPTDRPRLVMRAPVYSKGAPLDTIELRRAALQGFVAITIDSQIAFGEDFGGFAMAGESLAIDDIGLAQDAAARPVSVFASPIPSGSRAAVLDKTTRVEFGGRNWVLHISAGDAWRQPQSARDIPLLILLGGSVISLLIAALGLVMARSRKYALDLADRMTRDLRRNEERLLAASAISTEWYWEQDRDCRFVGISGRAHEKAGLEFARIRGKTRWDASPDALPPEEWAAHRATIEARRPFTIRYPFRRTGGDNRWLEARGIPRFDEDGEFIGYHGTGRDVTVQVETENRLKLQADLLRTILEHMDQGISIVDRQLRLIGWNRRFVELLEFPEALVREGAPFEDFVRHNAQRGEYGPGNVEELVRARVELARRFQPHYVKRRRPNGSMLEIIGKPLPDGGFVTTYTDVTEQEKIQETVRRERDFRQRLIESIPGVFYLIDREGRFLQWNRNFEIVTGLSAEEMQRAHTLDFFEGEDQRLIRERMAAVFAEGHATAEALFLTEGGGKAPYYFTGERIELEDGHPALIGVGFDISARKRTEEALAAQTAILQATLEAMEQGISVVDEDLRMKALNSRFCSLLEFPEEMARSGARFEDFVRFNAQRGEYGSCDVEEKVREIVERARHAVPHRFKRTRPNGRIIDVQGVPLPGGGFVTTYTDITEQERAQEALRRSEQRYRTLVDLSPDAVFVHRNHRIVMANAAAARLLGLARPDDAIGRSVLDFIHPSSRGPVMARIAKIESAPALSRLPWAEEEYLRDDGTTVPVEASATSIVLEDGAAVLSVARDISARREAESALRREHEFGQKLIESIPGIFYLFDAGGRFLLWNRNLETILGKTAEEIRQFRTIGLFDEADRGAIRQATRQTIETGSTSLEAKLVTKGGVRIPYYITGLRFEAEGHDVVIGLGFDISERKRAEQLIRDINEMLEQRVRERTAELEASNRELESFSYSVSHDLRSPLRALDGYSHIIEEEYGERLDEEGRGYLRRIRTASRRMGKLIDDLLDLARIGRQELNPVDTDLSQLAGEVRDALLEQNPRRKVVWDIAPGLVARADPLLMKVVLDNLLRNAWKFTAENDEGHIAFGRCATDGGEAYFVRDNGAGFEMEYADKLFKPFQRLHDIKRFEGTGIGLAIAHRILSRHGGRIWAEGTPGQGAAFYFTLS